MEKPRKSLKGILPDYDPPEQVWERLSESMDRDILQRLPTYSPSDRSWEVVERSLKRSHVKPMGWLRVAAVIVLLGLVIGWLLPVREISLREEALDPRLQLDGLSEVDHQYDKLMEACAVQKDLCRRRDFVLLKNEFELLRKATGDIQRAAGSYNEDIGLVEEHVSLEQQKVLVLNELSKII